MTTGVGYWGVPLGVLAPPPAVVVAPTRKGKPVSTTFSGTTSVTATLPQTPTAGNLLIATATMSSTTTSPTCSTPTGWNTGPTQRTTSGTSRMGLFTFWKLAAGTESNPSFTVAAGQNGGIVIMEWAGLDGTAPHLADSAGAQVAGSGTQTLTDAITTTTANEWVFTALGSNLGNTLSPTTWTLPQLSFDAASGGAQQVKTGSSTVAWAGGCYATAGAKAPQAVTNVATGTTPVTGIVSMSFKIAAGTRAQVLESVFTEYPSVGTTSWSATLATTPDPADVLVCAVLHADTLGAVSISGCGATWTLNETHDTTGKTELHVWTGINPTSGGTVTVTSGNSRTGKIRVLRVSGTGQAVTSSYNRNTGTTGTGPSVTAGPAQLVVALQGDTGIASSDYPITSATPALGNWATDVLLQQVITMQDGWSAPTAPGTSHSVTGSSGTSRDWPTAMLVIG